MHKSIKKQLLLVVCLLFVSNLTFAAGLGKLSINSSLGEPFDAEIELLSVAEGELPTIVAVIVSEKVYSLQDNKESTDSKTVGVEVANRQPNIHNDIKIEVTKNEYDFPILKLSSDLPVNDRYLELIVRTDSKTGRLQREYTVLLDPPNYDELAQNAESVETSDDDVATDDSDVQPVVESERDQNVAQQSSEQGLPYSPEVTTQRGDTLTLIARQMLTDGVSLDQMLVGLYESNPSAFEGGNMNRLKVGEILRVPGNDELGAVDVMHATQVVRMHLADWNTYRKTLAGMAVSVENAQGNQTVSGNVVTANDKSVEVKAGSQHVVKLTAGEKGAGKGGRSAKVASQEEVIARRKSAAENQERVAALEKQAQDMKKLLTLKSDATAQSQVASSDSPFRKVKLFALGMIALLGLTWLSLCNECEKKSKQYEKVSESVAESDVSFEMGLVEDGESQKNENFSESNMASAEPKEFDLSTISLDLDDVKTAEEAVLVKPIGRAKNKTVKSKIEKSSGKSKKTMKS